MGFPRNAGRIAIVAPGRPLDKPAPRVDTGETWEGEAPTEPPWEGEAPGEPLGGSLAPRNPEPEPPHATHSPAPDPARGRVPDRTRRGRATQTREVRRHRVCPDLRRQDARRLEGVRQDRPQPRQ